MSSSSRCWLMLGKNSMKTYSATYYRLINITKVGCNFSRSCHEYAAKLHPQDNDGTKKEPEKKHRGAHAYGISRFHNKSAEEESQASLRLNRMIRKTMKIKVENYIESTLGKKIRVDVDNVFDGKEKPEEEKLVETVHKICDLYIEKISDACSMVQIMPDDEKELISSPVFAVGCLPLRSYSDFIEFDRKLRDEPVFRKSYVQHLRSLRMENAKATMYTMIGVSVADTVLCMYCGQGKGSSSKLAFTETELCKVILYEVAIMFPSVPSGTFKSLVSKKIFQTGLNTRYRKGDMYANAMEELKAIRKETYDGEEHDGEK